MLGTDSLNGTFYTQIMATIHHKNIIRYHKTFRALDKLIHISYTIKVQFNMQK
jgi:hypothetical protein